MNVPIPLWSSDEVSAVTGGTNTRAWTATGVAINMDDLRPGDLYFATGDDDLEQVFAKGAAAVALSGGTGSGRDWPALKVPDVFQALQNLAGAARYRTHGTIISVQGRKARQAIGMLLGKTGQVHQGGRHLSLGLANLPENVEYGLFGFSPAVRPDIAVITDPAGANSGLPFESVSARGTVVINADHPESLALIARAKAAGIQDILTYGHQSADAKIQSCILADNGSSVSAKILEQEVSFFLPGNFENPADLVAGLLILKLTGKNLMAAIHTFEAAYSPCAGTGGAVTLIDPALRERRSGPQAAFKITNMIDWGFGRQTAVLDNFAGSRRGAGFLKKDLAIPRKLASLDFVFTGRITGALSDARSAIGEKHRNMKIEPIAPDVLVPGDFLVFRQARTGPRAVFSEALRLIPHRRVKKPHAL